MLYVFIVNCIIIITLSIFIINQYKSDSAIGHDGNQPISQFSENSRGEGPMCVFSDFFLAFLACSVSKITIRTNVCIFRIFLAFLSCSVSKITIRINVCIFRFYLAFLAYSVSKITIKTNMTCSFTFYLAFLACSVSKITIKTDVQ